MVDDWIVQAISNLPPVVELCPGAVFPDVAPQGQAAPYITFALSQGQRVRSLSGNSTLAYPIYALSIYAIKKRDVRRIAEAIIGLTGVQPGIKWVWASDQTDMYETPLELQQQGLRRETIELTIWHEGVV